MMVVQTFYLKPSCEFRSILIMLDFGQGKLNPPDAKKELANFFFARQVCKKTFAFCDYVGLLQNFLVAMA